jgi:hypothetical protein
MVSPVLYRYGSEKERGKVSEREREDITMTTLFIYLLDEYVKGHRQIGLDGLGRILEDVRPPDAYLLFSFLFFWF